MPRQNRAHRQHQRRISTHGRMLGVVLISAGLVATTSCTQNPEPDPVTNPVKLMQNVRVGLSSTAAVESIEGTTISVGADGKSSAEEATYDAAETVGELPVRVSLQYRAGDKSGSDLDELQGHTGPVEINLTLENLTVKPQNITYDAAGQARSETALVGAPLTIAASTTLDGVQVDNVTAGSPDGATGTNGVLSSTADGAAVIQWATVLAPPRSGASTTLRLVADVKDFKVPAIDVAVQPGLSTDLTGDGVVAGAFSSGAGSEMELQRRTITLVSEVNTVLTKAGSTITDVRRNLEETSQTLGVKTAAELRDNSEALAATMVSLKEQLTALGGDLEGATKATQSTTTSQLQQTVSAVDAMLGDTSAVPQRASIDGTGCLAEVAQPNQSGTVYGSILTMASQLDAYAKVSAACRDFVVASINDTVGPENPTPEQCAAEAGQGSLSCFLGKPALIVNESLQKLVDNSDKLVADLQPRLITDAIAAQENAASALEEARVELAAIRGKTSTPQDEQAALTQLTNAIDAAQKSTGTTQATALASMRNIEATATAGKKLNADIAAQNLVLADEFCRLADGESPRSGRLSTREAERLRSSLTADSCTKDADGNPVPFLTPGVTPMDARLAAQTALWDAAITDSNAAITSLETAVADLKIKLDAVDAAAANSGEGLEDVAVALDQAIKSSGDVGTSLTTLKTQRDTLEAEVKASLQEAQATTVKKVVEGLESQQGRVTGIRQNSEDIATAFNRSILGLKSTSDQLVTDSKGTVDKQRGELEERSGALGAALDKNTQAALENIASSTSGSTRDVEGAGALLSSSLNKVMLDLGDRTVNGSGLLGSMTTSAAKADTADYQLALAAQNAEGYANIRSRDVDTLLLRQAQFKASLTAVDELPAFHIKVPAGATSQTLYTLTIGGGE